jgi:hypothetical protein
MSESLKIDINIFFFKKKKKKNKGILEILIEFNRKF